MRSLKLLELKSLLPKRPKDAHKGMFGHVLVIGGDYGMMGAVRIAGEAALGVGAGIVTIASHKEHSYLLNIGRPELICHDTSNLEHLYHKATTIVLGPGLGLSTWSEEIFAKIIALHQAHPKNLLIDADGLNLLAQNTYQSTKIILTPHPLEAARLLKISSAQVQADRLAALLNLQEKYQATIVLKGHHSLSISNDKTPIICQYGNPGMSSAGMGDLLSGVIAGLLAQGLSLKDAASFGVLIHAKAGDIVAKTYGERGLLATDLLPALRKLVN
jgi:ADP-dependent NAD(P)H-hydrate dehydratase / NAD(P)H-hydrate epimerase